MHFQQLLATAGSVKSQRCTNRTHYCQRSFASQVSNVPLSPSTTSFRQHFTKELYQGTRPQSHSNSELKLALSDVGKLKWPPIHSATLRTRTRAVSMHTHY